MCEAVRIHGCLCRQNSCLLLKNIKKLDCRLCFCSCRYYVAEGVKIFSQETWRQITQGEGKHLVERYMAQVVCMNYLP